MKKISILFFALLYTVISYGQLSGDIVKDDRKLMTKNGYALQGTINARIVFAIAVNSKGEITSAKVLGDESTTKNVQAQIDARSYVMNSFKFEEGTWFPKHHQGKIAITLVKPRQDKNANNDKEKEE